MGKSNNRNNNRGGNRGSQPQRYTGKNVDVMGDAGRMERHAIDVFRDMSRGRWNVQNIYEFQNTDFVWAALKAAERNVRRHDILLTALNYTYPGCSDADVIALKNQEMNIRNGWSYVYSILTGYINSGDIGAIFGMNNQLSTNRDLKL